MDLRNISAWSIRNPVVPIVIFAGLVLAGIVSFMRMEVQDQPDIEFPVVIVVISQPGAAPTEIENQITQLAEAAIQNVEGVVNINSTASEGNSQTVVEFEIGADVAQAVNEVKAAIDQIRGELPDGILEPRVFRAQTSSDPIGYFAVAAPDMTIEQLSWFVDDTVTKRLLSIDGMAEVGRGGGVDREILVVLDPARMQSLGVTASQVNAQLRQLNVDAAGGQAEVAGSRQSVRVLGNAETAYELSQMQVPLGGGRTVRLADFATVTDRYSEITSLAKVGGRQVVTFSIARARGASDVSVFDATMEQLDRIAEENPGVTFETLFTSVPYTKAQYNSSMHAMVEGAVLAVLVVFLFLRDWRATIIAALAIPLSAIPTFYFMDLMGFTLNSLSLLALGLVAGVLVDDAIVEIENIVRHMRMGKSAYQASIDAADEIGLAVVATTFSIVAVFLPVGLMGGVPGQFFKNFGLTVVVSVLMSLAVARMITPMVAAYFLKAKGHASHGEGKLMDRYMGVLRWSLDNSKAVSHRRTLVREPLHFSSALLETVFTLLVLAAIIAGLGVGFSLIYGKLDLSVILPTNPSTLMQPFVGMAKLLIEAVFFMAVMLVPVVFAFVAVKGLGLLFRLMGGHVARYHAFYTGRWAARLRDHRLWMVGIGFGSLIWSVMLLMSLPMQFFPNFNSDFSRIRLEMVPGTTLEQTEAVMDKVAGIINERPEVRSALERVNEGNARMFINLKEDRDKTQQEFERELTPMLQNIPDARVSFQDMQGGGGTGRPISVMLSGSNPDLLDETARQLAQEMRSIPGAVAPRVEADLQRPELIIRPRAELAASLGVTTSALSQTIRIATLGDIDQNAARFSLSDRQIPIRVRLSETARRDLDVIRNLPVQTASGGSVPLERVAEIGFGSGPTTIQRYNQQRRVFVGADLAPGVAKGTVDAAVQQLPIMQNLPAGVSNAPFGADQWQAEMLNSFVIALVSGILLVFAVLVLLYHRFISPLVNMGSLFLAPLGGVILLIIVGYELSMPVFIGILMLFGIVAKNSILLIDFAIEEMAAGAGRKEAIVEAGHKRAQPIVMTTVAMTVGMIPTAISLTGDSAWRAPMGVVVIGGLILSTLLTLLIVPAGFSLADGFEKRVGPLLRKRLLTYDPSHRHESDAQAGSLPAE
jgi:multidrug efflux pump subunit AcrB